MATNNISYVCKYVTPVDFQKAKKDKVMDKAKHVKEMQDLLAEQNATIAYLQAELLIAQTAQNCVIDRLNKARTAYFEAVCDAIAVSEDDIEDTSDDQESVEDDFEDDFDGEDGVYEYEEYDVECSPRPRKTKSDILTPEDAIKCGKASKMHKMAPKKPKRDQTKTPEAHAFCKNNFCKNNKRKLIFV